MNSLDDILLLGDPRLYEVCKPVTEKDLPKIPIWINELHQVLFKAKEKLGFGRGIAAPQLGIMKRMVYIHIEQPLILINPIVMEQSDETFEVWDDCLSIPNLLVKVKRHSDICIRYKDESWKDHELWIMDNGMSELVQHEIDHLDGILCTMRAIDDYSLKIKTVQ